MSPTVSVWIAKTSVAGCLALDSTLGSTGDRTEMSATPVKAWDFPLKDAER